MLPVLSQIGVVVLHTSLLYFFLILSLSLFAHRQTSGLSITELVIVMVLGSSVETAMVAGDTSLLAGLVSASTLLLCNRLLSWIVDHLPWLQREFIGCPVPLVFKGRLLERHMREAGLTEEDILEGIREQGYDSLNEVRLAVLEIDGDISVVPQETGTGD